MSYWLLRLACSAPLLLALATCTTDDGGSNAACESLCADSCQRLSSCGLAVPGNCAADCVAGLGDLDCSEARPVGQLTCAELGEVYACAEYCSAFCTSAVACGTFDDQRCVIGCASDPIVCNARSVAARTCDQLIPEARIYEDRGRALQTGDDDVIIIGPSLTPYGLCRDADECEAPLGCSVETNTCEACVSDEECTRGSTQAHVCGADGRCEEVDCVADDDCLGQRCDTAAHTCIDCTQDEHCAERATATMRPVCDVESQQCVACRRDEHCATGPLAALQPACDVASSECVECTRDEHCAALFSADLAPACDVDNRRCVECIRDEHCAPSQPRCLAREARCVECSSNADCSSTTPRCHPDLSLCGPCEVDADCAGRGLPRCSLLAGCVECTAQSDCTDPAQPLCDTAVNQCVPEAP